MYSKQDKNKARQRRHERIRNKIHGTADCPRLNVFRSNAHIHAQIIDDEKGKELHSDGIYYRRQLNTPTVDSQMYFYQAAYDAVERARAEKKHKVHAEQK